LGAIGRYLLRYAFQTLNKKSRCNLSVLYSNFFNVPFTALLVTSNSHVIFRLGALYKNFRSMKFSACHYEHFLPTTFFFIYFSHCRARLRVERSGVWIPEGERDFSVCQIVHIVFGSHPASHSKVPGVTSCG
jgi:hypothetical protein